MFLILEIGMLVFGIITLVKGAFKLSRKKVTTGAAAYVVGILLILPLPLAFAAGMVLVATGILDVNDPNWQFKAAGIEVALVLMLLIAALLVAFATAKEPKPEGQGFIGPNAPQRPMDANNPYASPGDDPRFPPR